MRADTTFTSSQFGTCLYSFVNRVLRDISAWRIWVPGAPRLLFS